VNIYTKKIAFLTVAALAALCLCLSCASESKKLIKKGLYECTARLETAEKRMGKKNYTNALRILDEIKYQCGGSPIMDTVYYYAANCHIGLKQYEDARNEFENIYREFPRSPFVEEAQYRIACMRYLASAKYYRDQAETKDALRLFGDYLDMYPGGAYADSARYLFRESLNKLAEKEFRTAIFYRKQKEHEAALIYYRSLLSEYPDSKFAPESVVGMAEMLVLLGRTQDAQEVVEELNSAAFDEPLRLRLEAVQQALPAVALQIPENPVKAAIYVTGIPAIVAKPLNSAIGSALMKTKIYSGVEPIEVSGAPNASTLAAAGNSAGASYVFAINVAAAISVAIIDVGAGAELAKISIDGKITALNAAAVAKKIVDFILKSVTFNGSGNKDNS